MTGAGKADINRVTVTGLTVPTALRIMPGRTIRSALEPLTHYYSALFLPGRILHDTALYITLPSLSERCNFFCKRINLHPLFDGFSCLSSKLPIRSGED